jgi:cation:H+ antiporter
LSIYSHIGMLAVAFIILAKSADIFVDSSVRIAELLQVPKMLIGIVLVGFATTAPEFAVSVQSAYLGHPEIALGNAVGSVICDDGLAMALAALLASSPILIDPKILKSAGIFLIFIYGVSYLMAFDGTLARSEGVVLVALLVGYITYVFRTARRERTGGPAEEVAVAGATPVGSSIASARSLKRPLIYFLFGLGGVILSARIIVWSCVRIAQHFGVPEVVIGLTIVAIGTSIPEIGTCIAAARKGQGQIAAGDIIGADILNILWIAGASSVVNPMHVSQEIIHFMFPWMFLIVGTMLISMRLSYRIGKPKGVILLSLYAIYLWMTVRFLY